MAEREKPMIEDLIKTLLLQLPNFAGLVAALYVVTRFILVPILETITRGMEASNERNNRVLVMLEACMNSHFPEVSMSNARSDDFSDERSGASHEEKSDHLT